jgi:O-antigen/teichoic acid export membrane protein
VTSSPSQSPVAANLRGVPERLKRHVNLFLFTGSNLLLQATTLVCQFWVLRFVPPEQMGVWAFVTLVEGYLLFTQLGVLNAMNREFPYFMGKGEKERALSVAGTAQAYALCNGTLLMCVFLVLCATYGGRSPEWRIALLTAALTAPLDQYTSYLEGTYRSGSEFRRLAWVRIFQAVFAGASLALVWKYGFKGYCLRSGLLVAVPAIFAHFLSPVRVRPRFVRENIALLLSTGWRLFLWNYLFRTAQSFPRLILGTLSGAFYLGLFVPVGVVVTGTTAIATSFSSYIYPSLTRRFAQNKTDVGRVALKAAVLSVLMLSAPVALGIVLLPILVPRLVPAYAASVHACQIALAAGLFECMVVATVAFAAAKAWKRMAAYIGCALVSRAVGAVGGYFLFADHLIGVAWGMLGASLIMAGVTIVTVRGTGAKAGEDVAPAVAEPADAVIPPAPDAPR